MNKIEKAKARILEAVDKGETRRDYIVKAGTAFSRDVNTSVTGCMASMIVSDMLKDGTLVEQFNREFARVEIVALKEIRS